MRRYEVTNGSAIGNDGGQAASDTSMRILWRAISGTGNDGTMSIAAIVGWKIDPGEAAMQAVMEAV